MLLAPLRWALRIVILVVAAIVLYFARHPGAGVADLAPVRPAPGGRHPGHGGGAVRLRALAGPAGAPGPGGDPVPPGLRPPDHGDRQQAAGRQVHRGAVGCRCISRVKGVPSSATSWRRAGTTATRTSPTRSRRSMAHGAKVVLVTTDPFHEDRSMAIASTLGLTPSPTPTQTSPITGWSTVPYFVKEAVGVGLGRIIGYNHLEWLHDA